MKVESQPEQRGWHSIWGSLRAPRLNFMPKRQVLDGATHQEEVSM